MGPMGASQLKATLTELTFVTGPPVRLISISTETFTPDGIRIAAVAA